MNKLRNMIIVALLVLPIRIYAFTGSVNVTCSPNQVKATNLSTCTITATTDSPISSVDLPYTITGSGSINSYNYDSNIWADNSRDNGSIEAYAKISGNDGTGDLSGTFNIGTFIIKAADNATGGNTIILDFENIVFGYEDTNQSVSYNIPDTSATITITEDVLKGLKSLSCTNGCGANNNVIENGELTTNLFTLSSNDIQTFSLQAVPNNSNDSVTYTIDGTDEVLNPSNIVFKTSGGNTGMVIKITVGSGDNQTVYSIAVTKPVKVVGELASLNVGGINIALSSSVTEYTVTLDDVSSYRIVADVKDSTKFTIDDTNNILTKNLSGEDTYSIYVKPIDNASGYTSTSYKITVKKSSDGNTTPKPDEPAANPKTGETSAIIMGIMIILSFAATIYFYRKNMKEYND